MFSTDASEGSWVFEIFMSAMGQWLPIERGSEEVCRMWYDRQLELRPDLAAQCNLRDTAVDPTPPDPPELVPEPGES